MAKAPRYVRFTAACLVLGVAFALILTLAFRGHRPPMWVTAGAGVVVFAAVTFVDAWRQGRAGR